MRNFALAAIVALVTMFTGCATTTYSVGPTLPFLEFDPGATHPVQLTPGAGVQVSISDQHLSRAIGGKSWDMASAQAMIFGSVVSQSGPEQMGQLSGALALCTMSSTICLGAGKHVIEETGGFLPSKSGWFGILSFSFALAFSPQSPPVGIAVGAAGLPRAGTLYFGRE